MEAETFANLCQQILTLSEYQKSLGWLIGYSLESFPCRSGSYLEATVGYRNIEGDYIHLGEIQYEGVQYEGGSWSYIGSDREIIKQSETIDEVIQSMLDKYKAEESF